MYELISLILFIASVIFASQGNMEMFIETAKVAAWFGIAAGAYNLGRSLSDIRISTKEEK